MRDRAYISIFIFATLIFIASIILTLVFVFQEDKDDDNKEKKEDTVPEENQDWIEYDSYLFSIFWAPSSCFNKKDGKDECYKRVKELGDDDNFIIHGLWPSYQSGKYMKDCNNVILKELEKIQKKIIKFTLTKLFLFLKIIEV